MKTNKAAYYLKRYVKSILHLTNTNRLPQASIMRAKDEKKKKNTVYGYFNHKLYFFKTFIL